MNARFPLASTASLIAEPARTAMLMTLLEGRAYAAGELARTANVSAQSASMHLAQLLEGGFVKVAQEGRHRYYRIASPEIAHAIEALGAISTERKRRPIGEDGEIRYARTCYDHLAGELAVSLTEAFERNGFLLDQGERHYDMTPRGEKFLMQWLIDAVTLRGSRRILARRCLDWTERRDHLGGALGAALCAKFLEFRWIVRERKSRIVRITPAGRQQLLPLLDA